MRGVSGEMDEARATNSGTLESDVHRAEMVEWTCGWRREVKRVSVIFRRICPTFRRFSEMFSYPRLDPHIQD